MHEAAKKNNLRAIPAFIFAAVIPSRDYSQYKRKVPQRLQGSCTFLKGGNYFLFCSVSKQLPELKQNIPIMHCNLGKELLWGIRCAVSNSKTQHPSFTFQATRPPQSRVGHDLLVLLAGLVLADRLDLAHAAGVQPVVRAHGYGHETEGGEGAHSGQ